MTIAAHLFSSPRSLLLISALLRIIFIVFGEWQDAHMEVHYTDIDYQVFSDAAALIVKGRSPFDRDTYRYSPLLALILVPNTLLHPAWGKFLFSAADLLAGHFIHQLLRLQNVPEIMSCLCTALWLFNPFTFTVATRGNCEAIVCCMILRIIYCLLAGHVVEAAAWYGLVVHFRIYPIIYVMAILIVLDNKYHENVTSLQAVTQKLFRLQSQEIIPLEERHKEVPLKSPNGLPLHLMHGLLTKLVNRNQIIFGIVSGGVFFLLTGFSYFLYGNKFLHEALLYHLTRSDPRHNFSIYFYHIYLHHIDGMNLTERLLSFVPQFLVQSVLTTFFAKDIQFCFFVQTVAFVAFNKVITAQYFVWFFCLFPLILPWTRLALRWKGISCMILWTSAQLHWLMWAYALEFQGRNVFFQLWMASIAFFLANICVLSTIICHHTFNPSMRNHTVVGNPGSLINGKKKL